MPAPGDYLLAATGTSLCAVLAGIAATLTAIHDRKARAPMLPEPAPRTATPEEVSAILRDPDTSPEAPYPCQIGVYCDDCDTTVSGDYIVNDRMTKPERLEVARTHLRARGWSCTPEADLCPPCAAADAP